MPRDYEPRKRKKAKSQIRQRSGDYRIFAGAYLTGDLAERVQALREKYDDKTAQISAPHVTLAGTYWRNGPATADNETPLSYQLSKRLPNVPAFDLQLGGVRAFGKRIVYLSVEPTDALIRARRQLLHLIGKDKHRLYAPHLTLAMRLKPPAVAAMLAELRQTEWHTATTTAVIDRLHLMQRGSEDPSWREIGSYPLQAAADS